MNESFVEIAMVSVTYSNLPSNCAKDLGYGLNELELT